MASNARDATVELEPASQGFRRDVQGLRAIAVLSVVLYHANRDWLGGGFVGVDIFFVISGYLIAGILKREIDEKRFSIVQFYRRRVRRLFPALFIVLAVVLAAGWFLLQPSEYAELGRTTVSTVFFLSNVDFLSLSNYFAVDAALKPLLHTWSLAVEEQFYIIFPALLFALSRFGPRVTSMALAATWVMSLALSIWLTSVAPATAFFVAPTRVFELLTGAILAVSAAAPNQQRTRDVVSVAGFILVLLSLALIDQDTPFPGAVALAPCLGAAAVLYAGSNGDSLAGRWISGATFQFFGALSYSLYLWHWPLLVYARHIWSAEPPLWLAAVAVSLAIAAAYCSWRFVEQPFIRGASSGRTIVIGAAVMGCVAALGALVFAANGFPHRFSPRAQAMFAGAHDFNPRRDQCHQMRDHLIAFESYCTFGAASPPSVAVWGDSFASELAVALGRRIEPLGRSAMQISAHLCPPAIDYDTDRNRLCKARNANALARLIAAPGITDVVLIGNFASHRSREHGALARGYRLAVIALRQAGKHVVAIAQVPLMPSEPPGALGLMIATNHDPLTYGTSRAFHDQRSAWGNALVRMTPQVAVVDPAQIFCDPHHCFAIRRGDDAPLYFDHSHLSVYGASQLAREIPLSFAPNPTTR